MIGKLRILFWIGVVVLFVPYLGITSGIRTGLTIVLGALIIWLTLRLRKNYKEIRFKLRRMEEPASTPQINTDTE